METVWFILIFAIVALLYGILCYKKSHTETVIAVEAGATSKVSSAHINDKSFKAPKCVYKINGEIIDSSKYIRLIVQGDCMSPRGIINGNQLLALKINNLEELNKNLHPNDIVLIYLEDIKLYKIRVFKEFKENNLITYYFNNGDAKESSKPHSLQSIKGIIKYRI